MIDDARPPRVGHVLCSPQLVHEPSEPLEVLKVRGQKPTSAFAAIRGESDHGEGGGPLSCDDG